MVKKLVVHLGDVKTGSTSIQNTMHKKLWKSNTCTLAFPGGPIHFSLAQALNQNSNAKSITEQVAPISVPLAESDADVGVLSAEHFQSSDPKLFKKMIKDNFPEHLDSVRLICYVRPHADRLVSMYAQQVKTGKYAGTLAAYHDNQLGRKSFMYSTRFKRWREEFGEQFTLRPMIRDTLFEKCVVRDFLNFAFESRDFELTQDPDQNLSMSLKELSIVRELHKELGFKNKASRIQQRIGSQFARILADDPIENQTKFAMHKGLVGKVVADYLEDAESLDAEFFQDAPMTTSLNSYHLKTVDKRQSIKLKDNFGPAQAHSISAMCVLISQMASFQPNKLAAHMRSFRRNEAEISIGE